MYIVYDCMYISLCVRMPVCVCVCVCVGVCVCVMCKCVFVCDYIGSCLKPVRMTQRENLILSILRLVKKMYMKLKKHCVGYK